MTNIGKHLGPSTSHPLRHRRGIIARHVDDRTKGKVNEIPNCFAFVTTDVSFPPFFLPEKARLHFSRGTRVERRIHSVLPDLERNDQGKSTEEQQLQQKQQQQVVVISDRFAPLLSGTGNWCGTASQDVSLLSFFFPLRRDYLILALIAERTKCDATYLLTIANLLHDLRAALVIS